MSAGTFLGTVIAQFGDAVSPLVEAFDSTDGLAAFVGELGWILDTSRDLTHAIAVFGQTVTDGKSLIRDLQQFASAPNPATALQTVPQLIKDIRSVVADVAVLRNVPIGTDWPPPLNDPAFWQSFAEEVLDGLLYQYLHDNVRWLYGPLRFIGVLTELKRPPVGNRAAYTQFKVDWSALTAFLSQPRQMPSALYGWGSSFDSLSFLVALRDLVGSLSLPGGVIVPEKILVSRYFDSGSPHLRTLPDYPST